MLEWRHPFPVWLLNYSLVLRIKYLTAFIHPTLEIRTNASIQRAFPFPLLPHFIPIHSFSIITILYIL